MADADAECLRELPNNIQSHSSDTAKNQARAYAALQNENHDRKSYR